MNVIYYVVKNDLRTENIKIRAAGVCYFKWTGDAEEGLLEKFQRS